VGKSQCRGTHPLARPAVAQDLLLAQNPAPGCHGEAKGLPTPQTLILNGIGEGNL